MLWISGSKKNIFQLNKLVQRWSFHRIYETKNIVFLSLKADGNMIFTDYWKVLVLNFSVIGNTVFFQPKNWWKDDTYVVFLAFYDIPGPEKYGFPRSDRYRFHLDTYFLILLTFLQSLRIVLTNMVTILMMSAKWLPQAFLK